MPGLELIIAITERKRREKFIEIYNDNGVAMTLLTFGRGTATSEVLDLLGLEASEKALLFSLAPRSTRKELFRRVKRELYISSPGTGIILSIPINSVASSSVLRYLTEGHETGENTMSTVNQQPEHDFALIVAVSNEGSTDIVMDLAREAGASGGTIVHAKGTNVEHARKFFGVSIASEKEMIFIVAKEKDKNAIMKKIAEEAGMKTPHRSVVFSLPVSSIAGLALTDED